MSSLLSFPGEGDLSSVLRGLTSISKNRIEAVVNACMKWKNYPTNVLAHLEKHSLECLPNSRIAALYAIDALRKQASSKLGASDVFSPLIPELLARVFETLKNVLPEDKPRLDKLITFWTERGVLPNYTLPSHFAPVSSNQRQQPQKAPVATSAPDIDLDEFAAFDFEALESGAAEIFGDALTGVISPSTGTSTSTGSTSASSSTANAKGRSAEEGGADFSKFSTGVDFSKFSTGGEWDSGASANPTSNPGFGGETGSRSHPHAPVHPHAPTHSSYPPQNAHNRSHSLSPPRPSAGFGGYAPPHYGSNVAGDVGGYNPYGAPGSSLNGPVGAYPREEDRREYFDPRDGSRDARDPRDPRGPPPRDMRDPRDYRDTRGFDPRENRDPRDSRDVRGERDQARDYRGPRPGTTMPPRSGDTSGGNGGSAPFRRFPAGFVVTEDQSQAEPGKVFVASTTLWVGFASASVNREQIEDVFRLTGTPPTNVRLLQNHCFVTLATRREAVRAAVLLSGLPVAVALGHVVDSLPGQAGLGERLKVNWSKGLHFDPEKWDKLGGFANLTPQQAREEGVSTEDIEVLALARIADALELRKRTPPERLVELLGGPSIDPNFLPFVGNLAGVPPVPKHAFHQKFHKGGPREFPPRSGPGHGNESYEGFDENRESRDEYGRGYGGGAHGGEAQPPLGSRSPPLTSRSPLLTNVSAPMPMSSGPPAASAGFVHPSRMGAPAHANTAAAYAQQRDQGHGHGQGQGPQGHEQGQAHYGQFNQGPRGRPGYGQPVQRPHMDMTPGYPQ